MGDKGQIVFGKDKGFMVNGWIEKPLKSLFRFYGGVSASRAQLSDKGYPYLHYGDIHGSVKTFIDVCNDSSIPRLDIGINKVSHTSLLRDGDVVFVDASEDDEGASRHVVVRNSEKTPFISGLHTIIAKVKNDEIDKGFREFCFQTEKVKAQFKFYAVGTKVVGVNKTTIGEIKIIYPESKSEQRRIATALSETDAFIAALEKFIVKKRAIKQGAMQELLTGKRRLPGFSGEWLERSINDYGTFTSGNVFPLVYQGQKAGDYPFYKVSDFNKIGNEYFMCRANNYISLAVSATLSCNLIPDGSIIFAKIGAAIFLERKRQNRGDCCIDNNMMAFIINGQGDSKYMMYLFQTIKFGEIVTATALPSLSGKQIGAINKLFPPTIIEQTAIATILSDIDTEIDALTAKLNKLRNIKQGMMSELLTGNIRLVEQEFTLEAETVTKFKTESKKRKKSEVKVMDLPTLQKKEKKHNQAIEDAVILGVITQIYANEQYPLAPFYAQKLPYLLHRHMEGKTQGYHKLAAGPYNPALKYKTALPIALDNHYVVKQNATYQGHEYVALTAGENVLKAKNYFMEWHGEEPLTWIAQFKFIKNRKDELELLATVDMAMLELRENGLPVSASAVKEIIVNSNEWKAKLKRPIFSDANINRAIAWSNELFGAGA